MTGQQQTLLFESMRNVFNFPSPREIYRMARDPEKGESRLGFVDTAMVCTIGTMVYSGLMVVEGVIEAYIRASIGFRRLTNQPEPRRTSL